MKKLLAVLCGIVSVFGALFFGMKLLGRFAKSSMRLDLNEEEADASRRTRKHNAGGITERNVAFHAFG